ncbi:MAG: PhnD/SsuA/transferrin family substrate-binding protein [Anaerolineales bacterium]
MTDGPLRFVTFLAPSIKPMYQFIADYVGEELGVATELSVGEDYSRALDGSMDVGFICGLPYVLLTRENPSLMFPIAAPVLQGDRYCNRPIYFSDVIVRRDSSFEDFQALRGSRWAFNEPLSQSGYGIVRQKLIEMGETSGFFRDVMEAGFHQRSIRLVQTGEMDASAIDSQVLEVALREHPLLGEELRVIDVLGPSTIQPVVASGSLPASLRTDLSAVLEQLGDDPAASQALDRGLVRRFEAVEETSYEDIREMVRAAEAVDFTVIR